MLMYFRLKDKDMVQFLTASALLMDSILHVLILTVTFWFLALVPVANMTRYSARWKSQCLSVLNAFMQAFLQSFVSRGSTQFWGINMGCFKFLLLTLSFFSLPFFKLWKHAVKLLFTWEVKNNKKNYPVTVYFLKWRGYKCLLMDLHR